MAGCGFPECFPKMVEERYERIHEGNSSRSILESIKEFTQLSEKDCGFDREGEKAFLHATKIDILEGGRNGLVPQLGPCPPQAPPPNLQVPQPGGGNPTLHPLPMVMGA